MSDQDFKHPADPYPDGQELTEEDWAEVRNLLSAPDDPAPTPAPRVERAKTLSRGAHKLITDHRLMTTRTLLDKPDPPWFIENLVPEFQDLVLHGDPGSRKTFVMLDLMAHAAHAVPWHGRNLTPGKVLYVLGEGVAGVGKRLRALAHGMGIDPYDLKIDWVPEPLNIFKQTPESIVLWAEFVKVREYKYVVFDTLHKNTEGMDENSSSEMGVAFANARKIAPDSHRIYVHHDTKAGKSPRGSGSIVGDVDAVISVKSTGTLSSRIKSDKIRDAEAFDNIEITFDEHDESNSIFIKTVGAPAPSATKRQLIVRSILAQPGEFTRGDVCCTVGDGGSTQDAFSSLLADGSLYTEPRANPKYGQPGQRKQIQVLFVDTAACPFEDLP